MSLRGCPSDAQLRAFADGELGGAVVEETIEHIDDCSLCQRRIEQLDSQPAESSRLLNELGKLDGHRPHDATDTILRLLTPRHPPPPTAAEPQSPPQRIGSYVLLRKLASGGMGVVYEARHVHLGKSVAIKWLGAGQMHSRNQAERVLAEWRAHGMLAHPHIVAATDAGLFDGRPYLVTELVRGGDLGQIVEALGPLRLADAAGVILEVASALQYAHEQRVAHLDIKPSNVMIDGSGSTKLLDLGTAQIELLTGTPAGSIRDQFGTVGFLPPERATAVMSPACDSPAAPIAADIYSLGCTLYYLLSGEPPFGTPATGDASQPSTADVIRAHQTEDPPQINCRPDEAVTPGELAGLQRLFERMMAKRPAERPQSMQQIVKELRPLASQADLASVIDAFRLLQPAAEPLCSGHTVRLTELLQPSPAARRVGSLKYVLTLVGFILAAGLLSWLITRGPSDQDVASAVRPAAGGKTTVADATWVATPRRDSGLLYASAGLRAQQHAADSTVVAASLRTLVPRYPIREVAWNERGDRLAVLTDQGCLRIYRWDGERLRLETLYEDAATRRRIVDLAWHPHRDRLLLAAAQRICRADFSDPARPRFDSLAFRGDEIRRIDCLNQGDHNLLLIVSARGLDAIDLRSEQPVAVPALASSERLNVGTGGAVFAVHAGGKIDCWRARYEASGQDAWTFQRLASHPIRAPHEVLRLAVDPEGQRLAVLRSGNATIFATQTLSRRTDIAMGNGVTNKSHLLFADAANSYRDEILVTSRTQIHLRSDQVGSVPGGKIESISSMALGGQLAGVCADLHPEGSLIAIACPGRLEVWNRQLQTVANLPPLKQLNQVLPSDLQTSAVICAADGSGVAISAEGALLGPNIPPLRPADMAYAAVNLHALLEHPTPELVQSTDWHKASPQRRPLKPFGLARAEAQRFTFASVPSAIANQLSGGTAGSRKRPTQTTFGAVFFPKALRDEAGKAIEVRPLLDADPAHVAIAARADVIAVVDALGRYICYRGSSEGGGRRTIGRLPGFSGDLSIALSRNGRRLFVTAGSRWRSTVGALDLMTRKPLWKVTFDQLPGRAYLNVLNNNTVLVTHRAGWRLLDPDSGATLRSRSTITEFGAVQARAELSRHDGSCYSWNEQAAIEPVAGWAPDLSLRWITLATATHGWLVIDPDGRIIAEKTASDPPPSRYIHAASHHEFAVEHDDYGRKDPTPPSAALTVLRHHNDGRVTLAPFLPAHVGRDR